MTVSDRCTPPSRPRAPSPSRHTAHRRTLTALTLCASALTWGCASTPRPVAPPCPGASLTAVAASTEREPRLEDPVIRNRTAITSAMGEQYRRYLPRLGPQRMNGTAEIWMLVDVDGRVVDTAVHRSTGSPDLDEAALAVAEVYRIDPMIVEGCAVPSWVSLPLTFATRVRRIG